MFHWISKDVPGVATPWSRGVNWTKHTKSEAVGDDDGLKVVSAVVDGLVDTTADTLCVVSAVTDTVVSAVTDCEIIAVTEPDTCADGDPDDDAVASEVTDSEGMAVTETDISAEVDAVGCAVVDTDTIAVTEAVTEGVFECVADVLADMVGEDVTGSNPVQSRATPQGPPPVLRLDAVISYTPGSNKYGVVLVVWLSKGPREN